MRSFDLGPCEVQGLLAPMKARAHEEASSAETLAGPRGPNTP